MFEPPPTRRQGIRFGSKNPTTQPTVPMFFTTKSWKVKLGGTWGGLKIFGGSAVQLISPGELTIYQDGRIDLSARYDPPGSGAFAFLATVVTFIIILVAAPKFGFCLGPGWAPWYLLITLLRRQKTVIDLHTADNVVIDSAQRRLGFLTEFQDKKQWIAFEITENFDEAAQSVRRFKPVGITEGRIDRSIKPMAIIGIIALVIIGLILFVVIMSIISVSMTPRR